MKGRRQVAKLVAEIRRPSPLAGVKRHPHLVMPQFWARFRRRKKLSRRPYLRPSSRSYDTLRPSIQHSCFSATADISLTARQSERNASIGWLALFNEAERVASSSRSASSACCNKRSTASQTFCNSLANFRDCPRAVSSTVKSATNASPANVRTIESFNTDVAQQRLPLAVIDDLAKQVQRLAKPPVQDCQLALFGSDGRRLIARIFGQLLN